MAIIPSVLVESRLDWLTATGCGSPRDDGLLQLGKQLLIYSGNSSRDVRPWRWRGYEGEHAGMVTCGRRDDSDILQLSGELADEWFEVVLRASTSITRLDLCVTIRSEEREINYASECYAQGLAECKRDVTAAGRSLIVNSDGGATSYIGARTSDLFGRVYDKHRESGDDRYDGCWRWEVECKGDVAARTALRLSSSSDRSGEIVALVCGYYKRRRAAASWMDCYQELSIDTVRPASTSDTRLRWLRQSVRPVVARLIDQGLGRETIAALGLDGGLSERWRRRAAGGDGHSIYDKGVVE